MGTRAQAFIGNPHDYENRIYLGSVAFDGYNIPPLVAEAKTAEEFERIWLDYAGRQDHYCEPERPYPFPWAHDIFISDITVAFFQPEGHPLGAYTDESIYEDEFDEYPDVPLWPEMKGGWAKKAVWVLCSDLKKIDTARDRANKRIEAQIQAKINELPYEFKTEREYHNCKPFQDEAKLIREGFAGKFEAMDKRYDKRRKDVMLKAPPIPGPAKAHSEYVRQPAADSIMFLSL
jgi:hypothetical protein